MMHSLPEAGNSSSLHGDRSSEASIVQADDRGRTIIGCLRFKPHLSARVLSATEVTVLGTDDAHALRGAVYAHLAPLLDGSMSDDAIAERLATAVPAAQVYYALIRLEQKGFIERTTPEREDRRAAGWWTARGLVTGDVHGKLDAAVCRLVSVGASAGSAASLERLLAERFAPAAGIASADLTVVTTHDYLDPEFHRTVRTAAVASRWTLPARIGGAELWVGPLVTDGDHGIFDVLIRRLGDNRPYHALTLASDPSAPVVPAIGLPETDAFAAAAVANIVVSTIAGQSPPGLDRSIISLDPWTLAARTHRIAADAVAAAPQSRTDDATPQRITLASAPKRFTADGGHRTCRPEDTLKRLEPLVSDIAGIIPGIERAVSAPGMSVYVARQVMAGGADKRPDPRANRIIGKPSGAAGKGATDVQARASCLAEAVERYSCCFTGDVPRRIARLGELDAPMLAPGELMLFSDAQYAAREHFNAGRTGFNWVPQRFDATRSIEWTPAWSLTHDRRVWLPTAYCFFGYRTPLDHDFCRADSNGCASGNTLEEAIMQGLFELIERDACAIWWYNRVARPEIDLASCNDRFVDEMVAFYQARGRSLVALDLTSDLGVPTVMAVSWRLGTGDRIHMGLGCHVDARVAASRAVAEINQIAGAMEFSDVAASVPAHDRDQEQWLANETIDRQSHLAPAAGPARRIGDLASVVHDDIRDDVQGLVDRLAGRGLETIVFDHTRPDVGFPVARVVVPGLRHFWARLAPGRLYDVPGAQGWMQRRLGESELNPIPFFL
jgi:bacteriocin biosynthesis cyclodehydratase domain-containing protein